MNIKRIDLHCWKCKATVKINLGKLPRNFACWQGIRCRMCGEYNELRMGLEEHTELQLQIPNDNMENRE